jgi:putative transposase
VEFVTEHRDEHGVEPICAVLEGTAAHIAPSTFYAHSSPDRQPSQRAGRDAVPFLPGDGGQPWPIL